MGEDTPVAGLVSDIRVTEVTVRGVDLEVMILETLGEPAPPTDAAVARNVTEP